MSSMNFDIPLDQHRSLIAVESLSSTAVFAKDTLVASVGSFMLTAKDAISQSILTIAEAVEFAFKPDVKLARVINEMPYTSMANLTVHVPQGLSIKLLPYTGTLELAQLIAERLDVDLVLPAKQWFAGLLAQPAKLASIASLHDGNMITYHTAQILDVKRVLQTAFSSTTTSGDTTYGAVFDRNADWPVYVERTKVLAERLHATDWNTLIKNVHELTTLTDKLYLRIKGNPEQYKMTNAVAAAISETIYTIASELEFVAAYRQLAIIAIQCADDTSKKIASNLAA